MAKRPPNRYLRLIEHVFFKHFSPGAAEVAFTRDELIQAADELSIPLPKNLGDIVYSFRYRGILPESVRRLAPSGKEWIIRPAGRAQYRFVAIAQAAIVPSSMLAEVKVPDATPGVISMYSMNDEQALLAKLRYNRLVDIFTGVACYSLQSHLRTSIPDMGQVETDEIYIGVDRYGAHYVIPVQAKGGRDSLSVVQIEQDFALCAAKFPALICQPIGAQFLRSDLIALFALGWQDGRIVITAERHYRLTAPTDLTQDELEQYKARSGLETGKLS